VDGAGERFLEAGQRPSTDSNPLARDALLEAPTAPWLRRKTRSAMNAPPALEASARQRPELSRAPRQPRVREPKTSDQLRQSLGLRIVAGARAAQAPRRRTVRAAVDAVSGADSAGTDDSGEIGAAHVRR
jgi:hypothetical protein